MWGRPEPLPGQQLRRWTGSSDVSLFAGIQVRHDQDLGYMHHKFAIVLTLEKAEA